MNDEHLQDAELQRLAQRLGSAAAERVDPERVAEAVVRGLRQKPVAIGSPAWWRRSASLRVAAAVALVVGAGLAIRIAGTGGQAPHSAHYVADDLRDLSTSQLRDLLGTLDQTLTEPSPPEPAEDELEDLTTEQLERLLQALEG